MVYSQLWMLILFCIFNIGLVSCKLKIYFQIKLAIKNFKMHPYGYDDCTYWTRIYLYAQ